MKLNFKDWVLIKKELIPLYISYEDSGTVVYESTMTTITNSEIKYNKIIFYHFDSFVYKENV